MKKPAKNTFWVGFIIGLGLLASLHGIVFHQYLQLPHVTESRNLKLGTVSDEVFHSLITMLLFWSGIKILKDARNNVLSVNWTILLGAILMGGGSFNIVEGIVNHHILKVHHVKPGSPHEFLYDLLFILFGAFLFIAGLLMAGILNDIAVDLKNRNREPKKTS